MSLAIIRIHKIKILWVQTMMHFLNRILSFPFSQPTHPFPTEPPAHPNVEEMTGPGACSSLISTDYWV